MSAMRGTPDPLIDATGGTIQEFTAETVFSSTFCAYLPLKLIFMVNQDGGGKIRHPDTICRRREDSFKKKEKRYYCDSHGSWKGLHVAGFRNAGGE